MSEEIENEEIEMGGTSIAAKSEEAMAVAIENAPDENTDGFIPSFFIEKEDRYKVSVDLLFDKTTGMVMSASRAGLIDAKNFGELHHTEEWFEFSVPTYDEVAHYRQRSIVVRGGKSMMDTIKMRNCLLVWCLKDWSLKDRKGNKQELSFNDNNALSEKSIARVYSVPPAIIDVVLTIFEKDVLLAD